MPTTITGLILLVFLLLPGVTYVTVRERATPELQRSVFRETAAVVVAGVAATIASVGLCLLAVKIWSPTVPNVDELIKDAAGYWRDHYGPVTAWALAIVTVATGIAAGWAWLFSRRIPHQSKMSSWWVLFRLWHPKKVRTIQCELDDGSCVSGELNDWSTIGNESPDRDLILTPPIKFRPVGASTFYQHPVSAVCVSARRIVSMFVSYSDEPQGQASDGGGDTGGTSGKIAGVSGGGGVGGVGTTGGGFPG